MERKEKSVWKGGSSLVAVDAQSAQAFGQAFQEVMELVADVSDREAGALADLFVFEIFLILQFEEFAVLIR